MVRKIVSGGQTGVDRAALDVALELGIPCGGWCPKGRLAEDGGVPARYPLKETPTARYEQRTEWNVRDSDGTLILVRGPVTGGSAFTLRIAEAMRRPRLVVDLSGNPDAEEVRLWLAVHAIRTLNVAGPRESEPPALHAAAAAFLRRVFTPLDTGA
jgi:Circularly permutated YpsA SLOG family